MKSDGGSGRLLTAEQERRYGRYAGEPTPHQLARYSHLEDADRKLAASKRWNHMRLGFAVQLGTVRFLGTFLDDPAAVPAGVATDLARQLGIIDPACLIRYQAGRVRWLHAAEIRERHGYREFTDPFTRFRLTRWLYALCWTGTDRPSVLFNRATAWLVRERFCYQERPHLNALWRASAPALHAGSGAPWPAT